jgi:methionine biosynthesis protein MetW
MSMVMPFRQDLGVEALRPDLRAVAGLILHGTRVLDLGCGDGELLAYLKQNKDVRGRGIELSETGVLACVRRGLSVRQGHLQEGLADYPDNSFDCVILSQTLQYLDDPEMVLGEMLRVGRLAVVSFPNWGYWRCRAKFLATGRMPEAPELPQAWHDIPRWQALTAADFLDFCRRQDIAVRESIYLSGRQSVARLANLRARTAVFALEKR